jgi:type I restriction enzyme S subunit
LLVCEGGEIGRAAIWNGESAKVSFQNHLHRLRPLTTDTEPRFYVYFLQCGFTQLGIFEGAGNKTTIPNLSRNRLAALGVPHPHPDEQKAISRALAHVRTAARLNRRSIEQAIDLRRSVMQTIFTKGVRGEPQKQTSIGAVPASWNVIAIGSVATCTQYGLSVRGQPSGAYPILRMNCQIDGKVRYRDLQYVDLDTETFEAFRLRRGDLLFNRTNSIELVGRMAIVEEELEAVFASYLVRVSVDAEKCLPAFLNYFMNWPATQLEIKKLASRAVGQANINASKLRTVSFPLPPTIEEQLEVVTVLEAIDRKIDLHRRKAASLDELFKALLHKLMTGQVRAADLDMSAIADGSLVETAS